jgi:hypothetical protein
MPSGSYFESRFTGTKIVLFDDSNSAQHVNDPVDGGQGNL